MPDAGSTLNHWPFPSRHLGEAYAYIMTHPGTPCVFWDHFMDGPLGETICKLIKIRRSNKINSRSKVHITWHSLLILGEEGSCKAAGMGCKLTGHLLSGTALMQCQVAKGPSRN